MLHHPADLETHRRLLPGVPHPKVDDGFGVVIVHMVPRRVEATHVSQTVHAPADILLRNGVLVGLLVREQHHERCLQECFEIRVDECRARLIAELIGAGALAPGANDRQVNAFQVRMTVVAFSKGADKLPEAFYVQRAFGVGPPFLNRQFTRLVTHFGTIPIGHVVLLFIRTAVRRDADHQRLSAVVRGLERSVKQVPVVLAALRFHVSPVHTEVRDGCVRMVSIREAPFEWLVNNRKTLGPF